jgi:hypothetical protein
MHIHCSLGHGTITLQRLVRSWNKLLCVSVGNKGPDQCCMFCKQLAGPSLVKYKFGYMLANVEAASGVFWLWLPTYGSGSHACSAKLLVVLCWLMVVDHGAIHACACCLHTQLAQPHHGGELIHVVMLRGVLLICSRHVVECGVWRRACIARLPGNKLCGTIRCAEIVTQACHSECCHCAAMMAADCA